MTLRVGQGYDVHKFTTGNEIVVGGVRIPYLRSLLAHSDGDVLLHALCDALLGAAGMGDIGTLFPDTDPAWANADSRKLLRDVVARLTQESWQTVNIDATIILQAPKMAPHIPAMKENIAHDTGLTTNAVGIKATTTEKLGFVGRGEGIAAMVVVLLMRKAADQ